MKKYLSIMAISIFIMFILTSTASAHQPREVESKETTVIDPSISKAYYGELTGESHTYTIDSKDPFSLYVGILMPFSENSKKDVKATIQKGDDVLAVIGGVNAPWKKMFEFFGQSNYWDGGEYKAHVNSGIYIITVSSTDNTGKYSLAVGEKEAFDTKKSINALNIIPNLKRNFFAESPISFILSPFGWLYILVMYLFAFIVGFIYRFLLNKISKNKKRKSPKNIGKFDRVIRLAIWLVLLLWAITTSWSPILLFFSGFALFEALFSWCGFYAAIGKNSCPMN